MESYRQLIRQAQRGDADAVTEIVRGFDGLIVTMALRFKTYFPDFEEAKSISTCALIDGIYTYDLMKDVLVVYHFKTQIIRRFNLIRQKFSTSKVGDEGGYGEFT